MKGFRGISEERMRERTGRTSAEWYRILGEWGAREKWHTLASALLGPDFTLRELSVTRAQAEYELISPGCYHRSSVTAEPSNRGLPDAV